MASTHEPEGKAPLDPNTLPLPALYDALSSGGLVRRLIELARDEDLGLGPAPVRAGEGAGKGGADAAEGATSIGDITTMACIGPEARAEAALVARGAGVVAGLAAVPEVLSVFGTDCRFEGRVGDGQAVPAGTVLGVLRGPMDEVLEVERTLLNLVGRMSGIATRAAEFVGALAGAGATRAKLYDTRKTTPGLRMLEKYAVRCGGGFCHRVGLYDAVLIKDNHIAGVGVGELAEFVRAAAGRARKASPRPLSFVEVEVDSLEQFEALLTLPAGTIDIVLLDNMSPAKMKQAAGRRDAVRPALQLEASGGISLETIAEVGRSGVDRISVGGLTHHAVSLDVALDVTQASRGTR